MKIKTSGKFFLEIPNVQNFLQMKKFPIFCTYFLKHLSQVSFKKYSIIKEFNDIFPKHEFDRYAGNLQNQSSNGVLQESCSSNMQQITIGLFYYHKGNIWQQKQN